MTKILHHSRFSPNPYGHGGEKRTTQIIERYVSQGYCVETLTFEYAAKISILSLFKSLAVIIHVYGLQHWQSIIRFLKFWKSLSLSMPYLESFFLQDADFFVWESTTDAYYYLPFLARKYNKRVVAYPHNIESLVTNQYSLLTGRHADYEFLSEVNALKNCDNVCAISRFDNHLLLLFGVKSIFFPYYPPQKSVEYLEGIKKRRRSGAINDNKKFFVLGTVHNPPTLAGMLMLIDAIREMKMDHVGFVIAGYGTEQLRTEKLPQNMQLKGTLDQNELENQMIACDALLIYQAPTTGALTRISEFLVADIPVFVNVESSHSHFDFKNVIIYSDFSELKMKLQTFENY